MMAENSEAEADQDQHLVNKKHRVEADPSLAPGVRGDAAVGDQGPAGGRDVQADWNMTDKPVDRADQTRAGHQSETKADQICPGQQTSTTKAAKPPEEYEQRKQPRNNKRLAGNYGKEADQDPHLRADPSLVPGLGGKIGAGDQDQTGDGETGTDQIMAVNSRAEADQDPYQNGGAEADQDTYPDSELYTREADPSLHEKQKDEADPGLLTSKKEKSKEADPSLKSVTEGKEDTSPVLGDKRNDGANQDHARAVSICGHGDAGPVPGCDATVPGMTGSIGDTITTRLDDNADAILLSSSQTQA